MDNDEHTFQTWDQLASQYQDKFMGLDLYNDTYDLFCGQLEKKNAHVLEIGCGPGNITKYLLSKRPDLKILGTDISPNMIRLAKINNPTADFKIMDCREMETIPTPVDAIVSGFCMPYLSKPACIKFIKDSADLLTVGGMLYFSTIEGDYNKSGYETSSDGKHTMFVYYHEGDYLMEALHQNGFQVNQVLRKPYPEKEPANTHLIFIARKK